MILERLKIFEKERELESYIPFSSLVTDHVIMERDGCLIATMKLNGIPFETQSPEDLTIMSSQLNGFYRTLDRADLAIQIHRVRRNISDSLSVCTDSLFSSFFSISFNEKTKKEGFTAVELYCTLILRDIQSKKTAFFSSKSSLEETRSRLENRLEEFEKIYQSLFQALLPYAPVTLQTYQQDGRQYSEQLSFYNFLLTGRWQKVLVPNGPIYSALGNVQVFIGSDTIQLQTTEGDTYAQAIEIKEYPETTNSGKLDPLMQELGSCGPYPFIETHTFCFMSRKRGVEVLSKQEGLLINSGDRSGSQIKELSLAIEGLINGAFAMGEYSYSLLVFGEEKNVRKHAADAAQLLTKAGATPYLSTLALSASYLHQLPGMFKMRPRVAKITSLNFSHLASLHNFPCGKRDKNTWGEAVTILKTPSQMPFYFNFHVCDPLEDSYGNNDLGNTMIIGTAGTGKTALMNMLLTLSQKYRTDTTKLSCIFFDKDRGAEIAIRALGGRYFTFEEGAPSGFNPFQLDPTPENLQFLNRFVLKLIKQDGLPVSPADQDRLMQAIQSVMSMDKSVRRLALLPQNLVQGSSAAEMENSLSQRLKRWIDGNDLAWVFDNPEDKIDFNSKPVLGIDGTEFLANKDICSLVTDYLLFRLESIIDGRRVMIFMDEFWRYLADPDTAKYAFDKLKTIRKQNGLIILATQSPEDILSNPQGSNYIQNCITKIFLPNTGADEKQYIEGFKLTPNEFSLLKNFPQLSRTMLIKQNQQAVVCRADLKAFPKALKVFSGSTKNINFVEALIKHTGEEPEKWLPYFWGEKPLSELNLNSNPGE